MKLIYLLSACSWLLLAVPGCPKQQPKEPAQSKYVAVEPIPAASILLEFEGLRIGMSEFDISQVYNAPKGKGDGFWRVVDRYGDVSIHTITFESAAGEPERKLLAQFYRDQLYRAVDRRDGITRDQAETWRSELTAAYGPATGEPLAGTEWSWEADGLELSFMQDNASELYMSGRALLSHEPSVEVAQAYLVTWEEAHPDHSYPEY